MNKEKKLEILNRLTKDGDITLDEALILLETEKEYVYIPINNDPWIPNWESHTEIRICESNSNSTLIPSICNTVSCISNNCICKK